MRFVLIFLVVTTGTFALKNVPQRPNIILMNMDDMGWGDLGINGEPSRETPNLDKMAQQGLVMPNFYTAAPLCSPSRAAMLTGRLPIRNGFYSDNARGRNAYTPQEIVGGIPDEEILISELLRNASYKTKLIGKWHLGHRAEYHPLRHGFEEWFGAPNCHFKFGNGTGQPNIPVYRNEKMIGRYFEGFPINVTSHESNFTAVLLKEALKFISDSVAENATRPFFLYWAPDSTHGPTYASKPFLGLSNRGSTYGDALVEIDSAVGDILSTLVRLKIDKQTVVIFTSDNGAALVSRQEAGSNGPFLCGKQTTFEGGFRTPAIFWWPSVISPGKVSHQVGTQMDFFHTFSNLSGISPPDDRQFDGVDLSGALFHDEEFLRPVFFYRGDLLYAVRYGDYKMHLWTWTTPQKELDKGIDHCPDISMANITTTEQVDHSDKPILFHLNRDPGERYPILSWTDEYKKQVSSLRDVVKAHNENLKRGTPQLNMCDSAVMNWSPPGCEDINDCQTPPASNPYRCEWDH